MFYSHRTKVGSLITEHSSLNMNVTSIRQFTLSQILFTIKFSSSHYKFGAHSGSLKSTINACITAYKLSSKLDKEGKIYVGIKQKTRLKSNRAIGYA